MNRQKIQLLLFLFLAFGSLFSQTEQFQKNVKIKIPTEWITKLRNFDYKQSNFELLKSFEHFISPNYMVGSNEFSPEKGGILNPMFVNLDSDPNDELIGLFGWSEEEPTLAVFKKIDNDWFLLYLEPFYMFYTPPELHVANNYAANKVFYIRWLDERGSGIYKDSYHFYKLIDNQVYPCLTLINDAHIIGWGLNLNQKIETNFKFNGASKDEIWVTYQFKFFSVSLHEEDMPWEEQEEISFADGDDGLSYQWDSLTHTYRPELYNDPESLTEEKIACFGAFGNDSLFVHAFNYEIQQKLKKGTQEEKKIIQNYIEFVKTEKKGRTASDQLEDKGQIGKLKFYGIKKE